MFLSGGICVKNVIVLLICGLLLCGCKAEETFETVTDVYGEQETVLPREIGLKIPGDAGVQVIQSDQGTLYLCDGYEITVQTMQAGDLNRTMRNLSGFDSDMLTVMETGLTEAARYEFVWSAAGEGGDMIGRAVVLDDGAYHYCVTVMSVAAEAVDLRETWQTLLDSFSLI